MRKIMILLIALTIVIVGFLSGCTEENATPPKNEVSNSQISSGMVKPAEFEVSNLVISSSLVGSGENLTICVDVENIGGEQDSYTAELKIDGEIVDAEHITLSGGEKTTVSFILHRDEKQTYSVEIEGLTGSFDVVSPAKFEICDLIINPDKPAIDNTITASAYVTNTGGIEGSYEATLELDGDIVKTKNITISSEETKTIQISFSVKSGGDHSVALEGLFKNFFAYEFEIIEVGTTSYIDPDTGRKNSPKDVFAQGNTIYYYAIYRQYAGTFSYSNFFSLLRPGDDPSGGQELLSEGSGISEYTEGIIWNTIPTNYYTETGTYKLTYAMVQFDLNTGEQVGTRIESTTFEVRNPL